MEIGKALTLVVKEIKLGVLVTNAKEIKKYVEEKIKEYNVDNYQHGPDVASKDRAELNASAKALNDERILLEKEWNEPFQELKEIVAETTGLIKEASSKLDIIVKKKEQEEKDEKRKEIEKIWKEKNFKLVDLNKIFNERWLNKTYKTKSIEDDMSGIISKITNDLASLDSFGEDTKQLKAIYLERLSIAEALNEGRRLKESRERLAELEEIERLKEEAEKKLQEELKQKEQESKKIILGEKITVFTQKEKEEIKEAEELKKEEPKTDKTYQFVVISNDDSRDLAETLSAIFLKEKFHLESKQSLSFVGSIEEIERFRAILEKNNLLYTKLPGIAVLSV